MPYGPALYTLLASAARTTTTDASAPTAQQGWESAIFYLDVTVGAATETLTLLIQAWDPASQKYVDYTAFPATAAAFTGTKAYVIAAGATETTNAANVEVQGLPVPARFRARVVHSSTGSWTYSLGASFQ